MAETTNSSGSRILPAPATPERGLSGPNRVSDAAADLSARTISHSILGGIVRAVDVLVLAGGAAVGAALTANPAIAAPALLTAILPALATMGVLQILQGYDIVEFRARTAQLMKFFITWLVAWAVFSVIISWVPLPGWTPRTLWFGFICASILGVAWRAVLGDLVHRWARQGRLLRRAIIVGGGQRAADLIRDLEGLGGNDIAVCGIFDDRSDDRSPPVVMGYPKLGTVPELVEFARKAHIDLLIVTIPVTAERRLSELFQTLWVLPVDIRLAAYTTKLGFRPRRMRPIEATTLPIAQKPISDWDYVSKRAFDIVVASLALLALSPVMLGTALAIKLDSRGPVFFRQRRYGFNNEVISVLKFRSLYHEHADPAAKKVVTKDDPRVTRVGRFIRKSSIDELPQLFNVLGGSLSLVGPRPHAVHAHTNEQRWESVANGYFARHRVKPGVTGWAQINGWRGEVDTEEKIRKRTEFDLQYIENWSLAFDIKILLRTPIALLKGENAY